MLLVDLWAYMGDILHYYVDRAAGEAFLDTATQKESILALANLFDYTPRTRTPARVTVYVGNSSSSSVVIPAGTLFIGEGSDANYEFYSTSNVTVDAGQTGSIQVFEGVQYPEETLTNSATGQVGQSYTISNSQVIPSSVRVFVYEDGENPTEWTRVQNVNALPTNVSGFSVYTTTEGFTSVRFGNRVSGRVPPVGVRITVSYNTTNGQAANIAQNAILGFKFNTFDGVAVTGSTPGIGGSDGESLESIKRSIKAAIQTQSRAVTLQDYVDLSLQLEGVYKSVAAYNPATATVSIYTIPYIADYVTYSSNTIAVDPVTVAIVEGTLQQLSMLGVTVDAPASVTVRPKSIEGTIYITNGYEAAAVKRVVESEIDALFSIENIEFGKDIRIGDVYRTIHSTEGVDYATITVTGTAPSNVELIRKGAVSFTTVGGISV
jgi:phage-related baseplate assembly protein